MAKYCPPLASSHSSGTSGQGATVLPCVFPPSSLWGLLRASELMSLPKPDRGLPEAKQMFLSLGCWGQPWAMCHLRAGARAACRRSFLEDTIKQLVKCIVFACLFCCCCLLISRWKQTSFSSFKGGECKKPSRKSHYFKACQHHGNEGAWGDVDIGQKQVTSGNWKAVPPVCGSTHWPSS